MTDFNVAVRINASGNLSERAQRYSRDLGALSSRGQRYMGALGRGIGNVSTRLDNFGNRWTALAAGTGLIAGINYTADLSERFTQLGIQASASAEDIDKLKRKIFEAAQIPEIRADTGELTEAVAQVVNKTGDLQFAEDNLLNIARTLRATGASGADIGAMFAELQKQGYGSADAILATMDALVMQGKQGSFSLKEFAAQGERVLASYADQRDFDPMANIEAGAAMQVINRITGEAAQSTTVWQAMLRQFSDPKVLEKLDSLNIQVFDPEAIERGEKGLRPINELIEEIMAATEGGRTTLLAKLFADSSAREGFAAFASAENIALFRRLLDVQADGSTITADSARAAQEFNAVWGSITTKLKDYAQLKLSSPLKELSEWLGKLSTEELDEYLAKAETIAKITAGAYVVNKGARMAYGGYQTYQNVRGRRGSAAPVGGVVAPQGTQDVRVTNWPKDTGGGNKGGGKQGSTTVVAGGANDKGGGLAGGAAKAGGVFIAFEALDALFSLVPEATIHSINETAGFDATGLLGDTAEGAMYGGMIGSLVPVIGTAVGAGVGGLVGAINSLTNIIEQRVDDRKPLDINLSINGDFGMTAAVQPGEHPRMDSGVLMDISP